MERLCDEIGVIIIRPFMCCSSLLIKVLAKSCLYASILFLAASVPQCFGQYCISHARERKRQKSERVNQEKS
jgi:hypothetical protein